MLEDAAMTIEEIIYGESKNVEFKMILPKDSAKYIKTVIAFANTQGGQLVVGVDGLRTTIDGIIRKESYELPVEAIREMIINAHCHRNLLDTSCIQVAIYDDRLEVTSPGGLYNGLTYEEIMNGHSKLRNRAIANIFNQMGLVESWGTGIRRIMKTAEKYGLPVPEIQAFDNMFRVNLYRNVQVSEYRGKDIFSPERQENKGTNESEFGEGSEKVRRKFGEKYFGIK